MHEHEEKKIADLLKLSMPPADVALKRDLWPQMLRRLDKRDGSRHWFVRMFLFTAAVPWFDWALLAVLIVSLCVFPKSIPIWLYNF
jgi:hypothetical protein